MVCVKPVRWRDRGLCVLASGLVLALFFTIRLDQLWPLPILSSLSLLILWASGAPQVDDTLLINELGEGRWSGSFEPVQIGARSLLTPFVIALCFSSHSGRWLLVWRDQVDSAGWRRLRRIILNCRYQGSAR